MDFIADLMWDNASRDLEAEHTELARTAALADTTAGVWPLVASAVDEKDLGYRLALAEQSLQAIADNRRYPLPDLVQDLVGRWRLLTEARSALPTTVPTAASREDTEQAMDQAVVRLAARAASDNPHIPMGECLRLAAEAVTKQADANPLAWESWGRVPDGPFTDRLKKWMPPDLPGPGATPPQGAGIGLTPKPQSPNLTPQFSDRPRPSIPLPHINQPPAPTSFSDAATQEEPISRPKVPAVSEFSDAGERAATPKPEQPSERPSAPPAGGFSDAPAPPLTPQHPGGPPVSSFSDPVTPHITPPRPSGPASAPTFSG